MTSLTRRFCARAKASRLPPRSAGRRTCRTRECPPGFADGSSAGRPPVAAALKNDRVHRTVYPTRAHAVRDITAYIDGRYNSRRLHSGLNYQTPNEVRNAYATRQTAA